MIARILSLFRRAPHPQKPQSAVTLDRFAERLSEHGDVARAASEIGTSASYGRVLLARMKKHLGWQAK